MRLGIDPTVDFAAKCVLGSPEHPAITLHCLNSVLCYDPPITDVEILNPINEKDRAEGNVSIVDIRARDAAGRLYNFEIQSTRTQGCGPALPTRFLKKRLECSP